MWPPAHTIPPHYFRDFSMRYGMPAALYRCGQTTWRRRPFPMWNRQIVRLGSTLGLVAALGVIAAPAPPPQGRLHDPQAGAQYAQRDDGNRGGPGRGRGPQDQGPGRGDDNRDRGDRGGNHGDWDRNQPQPPVVVQPPPV